MGKKGTVFFSGRDVRLPSTDEHILTGYSRKMTFDLKKKKKALLNLSVF